MANPPTKPEHPDDNVHYLPARDPKPAPIPSPAKRRQELNQLLLDIARTSLPY